MDEPSGIRKTVSLTHKQAGISAVTIAALSASLIGPLSSFFQSKEKGDAQGIMQTVQASQIIELKNLMNENKRDIIEKINDVIKGVASNVDKHETRIVNLEFIQMKGQK